MSELALQLIEENKRTRNPLLDLGNCGLKYELPEELLERLNLGSAYHDSKQRKQTLFKQFSGILVYIYMPKPQYIIYFLTSFFKQEP